MTSQVTLTNAEIHPQVFLCLLGCCSITLSPELVPVCQTCCGAGLWIEWSSYDVLVMTSAKKKKKKTYCLPLLTVTICQGAVCGSL